jgi:hypothetical protein
MNVACADNHTKSSHEQVRADEQQDGRHPDCSPVISKPLDTILRPLWEHRSAATEKPVLAMFERAGTIAEYKTGAHDFPAMNPDAWNMDQRGLDRPGNRAIQLQLQATYYTNIDRYPEWHAYFAKSQPPMLVVWGKGDQIFTVVRHWALRPGRGAHRDRGAHPPVLRGARRSLIAAPQRGSAVSGVSECASNPVCKARTCATGAAFKA